MASLRHYPKTRDITTNKLQDKLLDYTSQLDNNPLLQGKLISKISLPNGTESAITHGLNRVPNGWIVVDIDTAATIHKSKASSKSKLYLTASAACNISLWIF